MTFSSQGGSASELHTPFAQGKLQLHTAFRKKKKTSSLKAKLACCHGPSKIYSLPRCSPEPTSGGALDKLLQNFP